MATKSKKKSFLDANYPNEAPDEHASSVRLVQTVKITYTNNLEDTDSLVNGEIMNLVKKGCKIVSIHPMTAGLNPMYVIYNIIYEPSTNYFNALLKKSKEEDKE